MTNFPQKPHALSLLGVTAYQLSTLGNYFTPTATVQRLSELAGYFQHIAPHPRLPTRLIFLDLASRYTNYPDTWAIFFA